MYCPNCGVKLDKDSKFCSNCGEKLDDNIDQYRSNIISDDELEEAYIGKNYEHFKQGKITWMILLLGIYYLLYRKMWLYALIWLGIIIVTTIFIPEYIPLVSLVIGIILAASFSNLYLNTVHKKIEKIKQNNQDKTTEEIKKICEKKGGVSVAAPVITAITISFIVTIIIIAVIVIGITGDVFDNVKDEIKEEFKPSIEETKKMSISYTVPEGFKKSIDTPTYARYSYQDNHSYCSFKIQNTSSTIYESPEEYLKNYSYYSKDSNISEIQERTINKVIWKYQEMQSNYNSKYYYATINQDKVYLVEYDINRDEKGYCSKSHNEFIESVKFVNNNSNVDTKKNNGNSI